MDRPNRSISKKPPWILPAIIFSQFAGTSLWFAGNAILGDLQRQWAIGIHALGDMTSAVQLGFIAGTLLFTYFAISDRFSPKIVFFLCSLAGATANALIGWVAESLGMLLFLRTLTGFFLAGIYPVGMRIAAGWYQKGLGRALGFLVGALVLGTAFPHLIRSLGQTLPWREVVYSVSGLALLGGGVMLFLVPDGPYVQKGTQFHMQALGSLFRSKALRAAAVGYFGHMWELYAVLAFVPVILTQYVLMHPGHDLNVSFWSFWIIAGGALGCAGGGLVSQRVGPARVAFAQLAASGVCCLVSPLFYHLPSAFFLIMMLFWGIVVSGDSPQFSTLIAKAAPPELVGSTLTIVNCIGFSITIVSIQLLNGLAVYLGPTHIFLALAIGPLLGVVSLRPLLAAGR